MSVFDGSRREVRRVAYGGSVYWATPADDGLELGDGRMVKEDEVRHLTPCSNAMGERLTRLRLRPTRHVHRVEVEG